MGFIAVDLALGPGLVEARFVFWDEDAVINLLFWLVIDIFHPGPV